MARRNGVVRPTVHDWLRSYVAGRRAGLADGSSKPAVLSSPDGPPEVEARILESDLARRAPRLAADPPDYIVNHLGRCPERGAAAEAWDEAAARIDQHRTAFDVTDTDNTLGTSSRWEQCAFAESRREASKALRPPRPLARLTRARDEPLGLELGL